MAFSSSIFSYFLLKEPMNSAEEKIPSLLKSENPDSDTLVAGETAVAGVVGAVDSAFQWIPELRREVGRVLIGQTALVDRLLLALLTGGHVLLEGLPGLAKTLAVKTLAEAISASFARVQFTPDLLPADIVGTLIYHPEKHEFQAKPGPIFAQIVLADEINRAPAKVQSALLQAMQEHQVTLGDRTLPLPRPFLVLATQNPLEQEGAYPLPEAQIDRFMLKLVITYPTRAEERQILERLATTEEPARARAVVTPEAILAARKAVDRVYLDDKIKDYIVSLIWATRAPADYGLKLEHLIAFGASPRATLALALGVKAWAVLQGRDFVTPQDVKTLAPDILRHRLGVSYEAEAEGIDSNQLIERILAKVPVP